MAAPMRSTDFRSIVEPILNECFDGVYDQRSDEWSTVFREQNGIPRNYHEEPVLYGFGAAAHILAQVAKWQGRSVFAIPGRVDSVMNDLIYSLRTSLRRAGSDSTLRLTRRRA